MSLGREEAVELGIEREIRKKAIADRIEKGLWTQRDGSNIDITFMTTQHINNCIKMLQGKGSLVSEAWIDRFSRELSFRDYIKRIASGELEE